MERCISSCFHGIHDWALLRSRPWRLYLLFVHREELTSIIREFCHNFEGTTF